MFGANARRMPGCLGENWTMGGKPLYLFSTLCSPFIVHTPYSPESSSPPPPCALWQHFQCSIWAHEVDTKCFSLLIFRDQNEIFLGSHVRYELLHYGGPFLLLAPLISHGSFSVCVCVCIFQFFVCECEYVMCRYSLLSNDICVASCGVCFHFCDFVRL